MTTHRPTSFAHAEHTAHQWLAAIAEQLGTTDSHLTYRCTRAWLHAVRDHLSVGTTANLAAQLPELLRGMFYEGWDPSRVPTAQNGTEFVTEFVLGARVSTVRAADVLAGISRALRSLLSPGTFDHVLGQLPKGVRVLVDPGPEEAQPATDTPRAPGTQDRIARLENDVRTLAEALRMLARGIDTTIAPLEPAEDGCVAHAARKARQILLAAGPPEPREAGEEVAP
ncbi:DUF2267 domain-containing protein [Allokutzneria oryzae]|uniref:DUF2267 domain-containing protein n=1 Tax=Allokutzneria oryzae TaxID=1378989 RepID=A0ABV6A390_9PSEU